MLFRSARLERDGRPRDAKALGARAAAVAFPGESVTLEPGEGDVLWSVRVDGREVGTVERVPLDAPVWAQPAFGVELTLGRVTNVPVAAPGAHAHGAPLAGVPHRVPVRYRSLPTTPAALFDLALLVPDTVPAAAVEQVVREVSGAQLESVMLFDEFRGAGVAEGVRSLAWRLTFRHPERTLRDKEIEGRRAQLLKALEERLGVRPRAV